MVGFRGVVFSKITGRIGAGGVEVEENQLGKLLAAPKSSSSCSNIALLLP